ncbi:M15 family metallopeptidase [Oscillibacter sp. MSJ-2]|uniref:M15 family metallopeptidase n=2 Tax=Dysosmobacter acutus TaxID=2841504 RepID=A0ABS6F9H2_9FIRM|nr:M15 family metallopeptidase [Dysosmobacter acutus]
MEGGYRAGGTSAGAGPVQAIAPVAEQKKDTEEWQLLLVNRDHLLSEDYKIHEMTKLRGGHSVDSRIYPDLQKMMDDARAEGLQPLICSSYRTWDKQEELFQRKVSYYLRQGCDRQEAEEKASAWVARPGTSEHQAGLAVDIVDVAYQVLDEQQEQTEVQQWLMEHCAEYGFILRYPTDKSELTGVSYEPWHYRYVGKEAARELTEQGLCLEEYLSGQSVVLF